MRSDLQTARRVHNGHIAVPELVRIYRIVATTLLVVHVQRAPSVRGVLRTTSVQQYRMHFQKIAEGLYLNRPVQTIMSRKMSSLVILL